MTVKELIAQLENLNPNQKVFVWIDGERLPVHSVDGDWDDNIVDINVMTK